MMEVAYSKTNITGYKSNFETQIVKLPLKYGASQPLKSHEKFHELLANSGGLLSLEKTKNSIFDIVSYEVLNDLKTVNLTPLIDHTNSLGMEFQRIQLTLPHPIFSSHCIDVRIFPSEETDEDNWSIVVDLLDANYLFITAKILLTDFIKGANSRLTLDNFDQWGKISIPYSFELRSPPFKLKTSSPNHVIISLKDGGLLDFQRKSLLGDFEIFNFNEYASMLPLNFISGLLKGNSAKPSFSLEGISSNSVVDMVIIDEKVLITMCVNKVIKVWSLKTHEQVLSPIFLTKTKRSETESSWLPLITTNYLHLSDKGFNNKQYLSAYFTLTSDTSNGSKDEGGFLVKTWELSSFGKDFHLTEVEKAAFQPESPNPSLFSKNDTDPTYANTMWHIQDLLPLPTPEGLKFSILWKSNTSSLLSEYILNFDTGNIAEMKISEPDVSDTWAETVVHRDEEYYRNRVLNTGYYDEDIVRTSSNIFKQHIGLDHTTNNTSLRPFLSEVINSAVGKDEQDSRMCWYKINSLCEELKKAATESISLSPWKEGKYLVLNTGSISIIRPSHEYESFNFSASDSSEEKVASILQLIYVLLSYKTHSKVYSKLVSKTSDITSDEATALFEELLDGKISEGEIQDILNRLSNVENAVTLIQSLIIPKQKTKSSWEDDYIKERSQELSIFNKMCIYNAFLDIKQKHQNILLLLAILLLLCEMNDDVLLLLNEVRKRLVSYRIESYISSICFETESTTSRVESRNIGRTTNSLIWPALLSKPTFRDDLLNVYINDAYDTYYFEFTSNSDSFYINSVIGLINHNEGRFITDYFFHSLETKGTIGQLLTGLLFLVTNRPADFQAIFMKEDMLEIISKKHHHELEVLRKSFDKQSNVHEFLAAIIDLSSETNSTYNKVNYFHSLSKLMRSQPINLKLMGELNNLAIVPASSIASNYKTMSNAEEGYTVGALMFEKAAIDNLRSLIKEDEKYENLLEGYYLDMFELALKVQDYDSLNESLEQLSSLNTLTISLGDLFKRFLRKLIKHKQISKIFHPNNNKFYFRQYTLIDSILLDLANDELTLANSLKCYEYLYSWRLFGPSNSFSVGQLADKRGAIEALYMFITRFKSEKDFINVGTNSQENLRQYKLKVLELYMIILNCLASFQDDDDKWIIKHKSGDSSSIISMNEITLEYYEWLRDLESELSM